MTDLPKLCDWCVEMGIDPPAPATQHMGPSLGLEWACDVHADLNPDGDEPEFIMAKFDYDYDHETDLSPGAHAARAAELLHEAGRVLNALTTLTVDVDDPAPPFLVPMAQAHATLSLALSAIEASAARGPRL